MYRLVLRVLPLACAIAAPAHAQSWVEPPAPPRGAAPNQAIPLRDAAGNYATPNRDLSAEETNWHLRAALNVAALGCRDEAEPETVAAYNRMLATHRAALARADAGVKDLYRRRYGTDWSDTHDRQMTRVYNFFAQPTAHDDFCATAQAVLAEVNDVAPQFFADFAAESLPRLEAPFIAFYREYDAYRVAYAQWQGGGEPVTVAAAAPPPGGALTR